jgi:hypothetical protein
MKLPKSEVPTFETVLPITGKTIKFRPYLVKEQKIFLIALEGGDKKAVIHAISDVMDSCVIEPEGLKTGDLPLMDFEYLYLQLRCKSVSEKLELTYRCKKQKVEGPEGEVCDGLVGIPVNLYDIKPPQIDKKANDIILSDNPKLGVRLNYPSYNLMNTFDKEFTYETTAELIKQCVNMVYDTAQTYTKDLYTAEELDEWFECLNQKQYDKLLEFFNNLPTLKHDLKFHCKRCGYTTDIHLEGISSFFL